MSPAYAVDPAKDPYLEARDLAVQTVERLAVRVAVLGLKHVAQAALSGAFYVEPRVHGRERPDAYAEVATPLLGKPKADEMMFFAAMSQEERLDRRKQTPHPSLASDHALEDGIRVVLEGIRMDPHPFIDPLAPPQV